MTLVGHASWAEKTLIDCGRFYPPDCKTPEARLRYYASIFPLVEVDSSYYAIPSQTNTHNWAARTPEGFVFNVKAFRFFTGHQTDVQVLPRGVKELLPGRKRLLYRDTADEVKDALWDAFSQSLEPLRLNGKLGLIHFQFPPSVVPSPRVVAHLESIRQKLPRDTISVEFRHSSWWDGTSRTVETLAMLRGLNAVHTVVDGPRGFDNSVPPIWEVTNPNYMLVRLHGRNTETYNAAVSSPAERFSYEYSDSELKGIIAETVRLAYKARHAHMIFNNCDEDKGVRNGMTALKMLVQYGDGKMPDLKDPFHPNGVLAAVSVEELSAASNQLPPPAQGEPEIREAEVDVARIGRVRITFQLREMRHHKSSHMHWAAVFAQPI
ncbi:uncharacterized protein YecE (DUF72 family) [Variovorax sp. SG517]|uniref:DUF72 domain-containing protein n=1 Tax=Variovorax sp. SG517 TaxID=2587117 RepID=UPI00159EA238|nr:DUF72 domain-containing protein [Variovorax sp. SG517]NVM91093.1 uncharacterized protein YecE (DUF72 family) [Variovorax sp. SG517]